MEEDTLTEPWTRGPSANRATAGSSAVRDNPGHEAAQQAVRSASFL
jgi:hypothetical protein